MTKKQLALSLTLILAIPLLAAVPQKEKTAEILLAPDQQIERRLLAVAERLID